MILFEKYGEPGGEAATGLPAPPKRGDGSRHYLPLSSEARADQGCRKRRYQVPDWSEIRCRFPPKSPAAFDRNQVPVCSDFCIRRNARDLRKGIFGPKGLRQVPDSGGGVMDFNLPKGWTLRLTYHAAGDYDFERRRMRAADVEAEFIPPRPHRGLSSPLPERNSLAAVAHP